MRIGRLYTLLIVMGASSAHAQNGNDLPERRAVAHALYVAQERDKITDALIKSVAQNYVEQLAQLHPALAKDHLNNLRVRIEKNMADTEQDYLAKQEELIAQRLKLRDLQAGLDFYKSPAGHRLAEATPALIAESGKNQTVWSAAAITKATNDLNAATKVPR